MSEEDLKENNFRMPAEWEEHEATWLAWPNDPDYFGERIKNIEKIYLQMIFALHKDERVKLLVLNEEMEIRVKKMISDFGVDLSRVIFYQTEYVDVWVRDYGPTYVKNMNKKAWVKWHYDAYGKKFPELFKDNEIFLNLKEMVGFEMFSVDLAMEGGAIDSNGLGIILTTEECLIKNRNLKKGKEYTENIFKKYLGAQKIIWLKNGLLNDHTDGHIDEVARFIGPSKIVCAYEDDKNDENYTRLSEDYEILKNAIDQDGNTFEVIKLPMPHMYFDEGDKEFNGKKAPVSYANFYIGNETVLMSLYGDENDARALSIIQSCFPDKKVIGIDCRDLVYGGGAIHCITQQEQK